jgi:hypothetical protein
MKTISIADQRNGLQRRVTKTVLPIMEVASGGTPDGYTAPAKVAHEVTVLTTIIVSPRATAQNIADALKLHQNTMGTDAGAAGVAGATLAYVNQNGEALVQGIMPA